jgi:DNA polymerase III delta prime subunit
MPGTEEWTKKYEPKRLEDMVLHPSIRDKLRRVLRTFPSMILFSPPGMGKGTFTNIFLNETRFDHMWINASDERGIDKVRADVSHFAMSGSANTWFPIGSSDAQTEQNHPHFNIVVFNEADSLTSEAQKSLKQLMEDVEKHCRFIFMTNNIDKIEDAIRSRCIEVEFKKPPPRDILNFLEKILENEGVRYDEYTVSTFVSKYYPDIRKIIKEIRANCENGVLKGTDILSEEERVNKTLVDLKLFLAFNNYSIKGFYHKIKDRLEDRLSERQFYYLLEKNHNKKVSRKKKLAVIKIIEQNPLYKEWLHQYLMMEK